MLGEGSSVCDSSRVSNETVTAAPRKNDVVARQNADKLTAKKQKKKGVKIQHLSMTSARLIRYDMFTYAGEFK